MMDYSPSSRPASRFHPSPWPDSRTVIGSSGSTAYPTFPEPVFSIPGGLSFGRSPAIRRSAARLMWLDYNGLILATKECNMAKGRAQRRDAMDSIIESALQPGRFIGWNEGSSFVSDLRHLESEIAKVVS